MDSQTKTTLAKALLACPSMKERSDRDPIVHELPEALWNMITRNDAALPDVKNIITAALNYEHGLDTLIELVRAFEGDSLPMREVDQVMAAYASTSARTGARPALKAARQIQMTLKGNVESNGRNVYILKSDFAGDYASLANYYRDPSDVLTEVEPDPFSGRADLEREVEGFLDPPRGGYFIIEGQGGLGKTAFLAWLVKHQGYIHHFVRPVQGQDVALSCMRNLAAQIILACQLDLDSTNAVFSAAVAEPEHLGDLLKMAIEKTPGQRIVVVIDAIDDARGPLLSDARNAPNVLNLPRTLPEGAYIIVSQRPMHGLLDVNRPGTRRKVYHLRSNSVENEEALRSYLGEVALRPAVVTYRDGMSPKVTVDQFVDTLFTRSQGLWIYLHHMIAEIEYPDGSPPDLSSLPVGIIDYYLRFLEGWRDRHKEQWPSHLTLLATLAVAPGPISAARLIDWAGADIGEVDLADLLGDAWSPFITQVDREEAPCFQLYHAILRELFTKGMERSVSAQGGRKKPPTSPVHDFTEDQEKFVRSLGTATAMARRRVVGLLRKTLLDEDAQFAERRFALDQLIRLHWLEEPRFRDDLTMAMELIGPFLDSELVKVYLAGRVEAALAESAAAGQDRERVHLLVYRAVLHGASNQPEKAEDRYKRAGAVLDVVMASDTVQPDDHWWMARIQFGQANIQAVRAEQAEQMEQTEYPDRENPRRGRKLRWRAQELYRLAAESAGHYGQVPTLAVNIGAERCLNAACLGEFAEAEKAYQEARTALAGVEHPDMRDQYSAHLLEAACNMHSRWAKAHKAGRETHYRMARVCAEQQIDLLKPDGSSEELVWAHLNCAEYCLALAEECGDPGSMAAACEHWESACEIATGLELSECIEEAQPYLTRYCAGHGEGS